MAKKVGLAIDTINYVATDQSGLTATSTRTVIVEQNPATPSLATSTPQTGQGSATGIASSTSPAIIPTSTSANVASSSPPTAATSTPTTQATSTAQ